LLRNGFTLAEKATLDSEPWQTVAGGCQLMFFHAIGDMLARNPHGIAGGLHINRVGDAG
jgi:hypothetical protein